VAEALMGGREIDTERVFRMIRTLAIAAAGGGVFALLSLPAAWLTGAMVAVAIVAMSGVRLEYPPALRSVVLVVIGSSLGTGVSPQLIGQLAQWPVSLAILAITVGAIHLASEFFLRRVCGWDRQTSFFAAIPGMANYVILLAAPSGADVRRIALSQTVRVFVLVGLTPSVLRAVEGAVTVSRVIASPFDIALTLLVGTVGGIALGFAGIPAAPMIGAMVASGLLHGSGLATGYFPPSLQAGLYVALGAFIGCRFMGTTFAMLRGTIAASLGALLVAVTLSALGAYLAAVATGKSFSELALAFAPGGLDVMTTMAFALNLDSAFVAGHQLVRFLLIAVYAPLLSRRRPAPAPEHLQD
jgi:membrane AbrB-like protein